MVNGLNITQTNFVFPCNYALVRSPFKQKKMKETV